MTILGHIDKLELIKLIKMNVDIFYAFEKVYIFGSILKQDCHSNDIDILLLYSKTSPEMLRNVSQIIENIEQKTSYPLDVTVLSFEEEKELHFIDSLSEGCMCIKG